VPKTAPIPISGVGPTADPGQFLLTFDQDIFDQTMTGTNWSFRFEGNRWAVATAGVFNGKVGLDAVMGAPDAGPDAITFTPPPFDILGRFNGLPAAAFTDFLY
jgi:hypothetical protein